jgi:hypothetical protein
MIFSPMMFLLAGKGRDKLAHPEDDQDEDHRRCSVHQSSATKFKVLGYVLSSKNIQEETKTSFDLYNPFPTKSPNQGEIYLNAIPNIPT